MDNTRLRDSEKKLRKDNSQLQRKCKVHTCACLYACGRYLPTKDTLGHQLEYSYSANTSHLLRVDEMAGPIVSMICIICGYVQNHHRCTYIHTPTICLGLTLSNAYVHVYVCMYVQWRNLLQFFSQKYGGLLSLAD